MGEVGEQGLEFHLEVLRQAHAEGLTDVHVSGQWMAQAVATLTLNAEAVPQLWRDVDELAAHMASSLARTDGPQSLLVKGSRFMRMERVVQAVMAQATQNTHLEATHVA
jgi:UDP-N-acetylmuramoyl-tripeptide--D-alanyl-D-alanine ligase